MENLPASLLSQQAAARPRSGAELEAFGKQAASCYLDGRCSTLTEAVVSTVKTAGLSPEQVRRVVEFCNQDAYLREFNKEGSAHRVVHFKGGPADPAEALRDLNDGGGGSLYDAGLGDYALPPPSFSKAAAANALRVGLGLDTKLAEAFAAEDKPLPYAEPLRDALDAKSKLASLSEEARIESFHAGNAYLDACERLFQQTKQAAMGGTPLGHLVAAWSQVNDDPVLMKAAFAILSDRLVDNGVFTQLGLEDSLQKTAGAGVLNPQHPLAAAYGSFCSTLEKVAALRLVSEELAESTNQLDSFLLLAEKQAGAAELVGKAVGSVPKAFRAATKYTAEAAPGVQRFVQEAAQAAGASEGGAATAGKLLGGAVKYSPHVAAGLAAEEAYQKLRFQPAVQGVNNFVLSRVPYTQPWLVRQHEMMRSMY